MIELLLQDKEGFSVMETNNGQSVFSSIDDVNSENMKPRKNHLVHLLRCIVNNMIFFMILICSYFLELLPNILKLLPNTLDKISASTALYCVSTKSGWFFKYNRNKKLYLSFYLKDSIIKLSIIKYRNSWLGKRGLPVPTLIYLIIKYLKEKT